MQKETKKLFPKDFLWGASTSSHQVEGGNHNQWTIWEKENADYLAENAEKLLKWRWKTPVWPEIEKDAKDPQNYISGRGVDHYDKYKQDFDLLNKLNLNSFRFSLEWSRIEPEEGQWNQEAIDHYKSYISELKKRKVEPVLNIWHTSLPVWFAARGGFKHRRNLKYFKRYIHLIQKEFIHDIKYVITLNEPNIYATYGYLLGLWPPQQKNVVAMMRVYWNLVRAHKHAYYSLKMAKPSLQIGIAAQLANIQAKDPHDLSDELS